MSPDVAMPSESKEKPSPVCRVCVSKDDAAKMKVGSSVSLDVSGTVKSLHPSYEDKEQYEVEIENPTVEVEDEAEDESGENDDNMATMPREKLKKKIMPKDEE